MNDKLHTYLKKAGEEVSLTHEERERMRSVLHAYMEMKPLRAPTAASAPGLGWFFTLRPAAAALVLVFFASSAGISYAAENALPGDLLYPVKTHVNEPVRGALAISASAKAAWAADVAGERVKEAATLAAEGRLGTTTQQELQADFQEHAQMAVQNIGEQASSSPETGIEAAVRFAAQLSEYENVLVQVGAAKHIDVSSLASVLKIEGEHVAGVRAQAESHVSAVGDEKHTASHMQTAARKAFESSTDLARSVSGSLSASSSALVAAQLDSASTSISAGEDFTTNYATSDAIGAFQSALTASEKLGVFLQTSSAIHARTGFVVGEPGKGESGKNTRPEDKNNRPAGNNAERVQTSVSASTTAPTTGTNENSGAETDTGVQTQTEEHKQTGDTNAPTPLKPPTLPISVPEDISI